MDLNEENSHSDYIDKLLKGALKSPTSLAPVTLRERFNLRVQELNVSATAAALEILNIQWRALNGILDGTQKNVDFTALSKLARFLGIAYPEVIELYLQSLEVNYKDELGLTDKGKFILKNFDLANLKKAGIIDTINDFEHIEKQLIVLLGLKDIIDYRKEEIDAAFSAGKIEPKNSQTRNLWIAYASAQFEVIANPYEYKKEALIDYFPNIRWHSTNTEKGLYDVTRALYGLGITVIFQPMLPTLHLRGATFSVHGKPCIVLTDYKGFYPTLWFALTHELFHVLFDWDDIQANQYHLSDEETDIYTVKKNELEADNFARQYLFPDNKMQEVRFNMNDDFFINRYAESNNVHPSIIYAFNAFDKGKEDLKAWPRAVKKMPDIKTALDPLIYFKWEDRKPALEVATRRKNSIFNNL
jgi:HTH-type transcriptional regulator / antitoxin HigA